MSKASDDEQHSDDELQSDDDGDPRRNPLRFLPVAPFDDSPLSISGDPIHILDPAAFDEETDKRALTLPLAVATTLWLWCSGALRAWLDRDRFYNCEWACRTSGLITAPLILFARNDRQISIAFYNKDAERLHGCDFGMPPTGPWVPLSATMSGSSISDKTAWPGVARDIAADLLYNPTWKAGSDVTHSLQISERPGYIAIYPNHLGDSGRPEVDPHWFYRPRSMTICQRCDRSEPDLRRCTACLSAYYCSKQCQKDDWAVHKAACKKLRES